MKSEGMIRRLLAGMSVALQWVCDEGGVTLERLLYGEPIGRNKTEQEIEQAFADADERERHLRQ